MPDIDELVARDVKTFHLEMLSAGELSMNIDDALVYVCAMGGKLSIRVADRDKLEIRS